MREALKRRHHVLLQASVWIFFFVLGAKVLNFFKKILIGVLFGVSSTADAYFAASYLPYYGAIFFEGIIFLVFLPSFAELEAKTETDQASQFLWQVLVMLVLFTSALALLGCLLAPSIVSELVPGFTPAERALTAALFRTMSLVLIFISLCSFFRALNSYYENFLAAASSGLMDTVLMIGITILTFKMWGIHAAAWGSACGAFIACAFQYVVFRRRRSVFPKRLSYQTQNLKRPASLLFPLGMIWIFQQIPLVIMNRFGSGMWEGTISALIIAYALGTVPMALVSHTVLLSVFPSLAKHASESSPGNVKDTFFQTLRGSFFILIPVGFFLSGFAKPIAALCVSGGEITLEGTTRIANALIGFGWSVFVLYADLFVTQCLIAVRKTTAASVLGVARAVLTYLLSYLFVPRWDYQGLALAFSAALALNFFVLFPWILSPSPFVGRWKEIFVFSGKVLLASSPILLCGALASRWTLEQWMGLPAYLLVLAMIAGGLIGTVCYLGVLALMKLEEFHTVLRSVRLAFAWQKKDTFVADLGD